MVKGERAGRGVPELRFTMEIFREFRARWVVDRWRGGYTSLGSGLKEHDKAYTLANLVVNTEIVERNLELSGKSIKCVIRRELLTEFEESRNKQIHCLPQ